MTGAVGSATAKPAKPVVPGGLTGAEAGPAGRGHMRLGTKAKRGYRTNWKLLGKPHESEMVSSESGLETSDRCLGVL